MVGFWCKPASWLVDDCFLLLFSHGREQRERGTKQALVVSLIWVPVPS